MTRPTAFSLPGMAREEKITRSPLPSATSGCSSCGDARQCGARLALAAGAQRQHLVRRQVAVGRQRRETPARRRSSQSRAQPGRRDPWPGRSPPPRGRQRAPHRPPRAMRPTWEANVVTATRAGADEDQLGKRLCHLRFRGRAAVADRIGGIADERQHALVAQRRKPRRVGRRADHRRRIDLPVAGVQHGAVRRADRQRIRFRDRMGDVDEVDRRTARASDCRRAAPRSPGSSARPARTGGVLRTEPP